MLDLTWKFFHDCLIETFSRNVQHCCSWPLYMYYVHVELITHKTFANDKLAKSTALDDLASILEAHNCMPLVTKLSSIVPTTMLAVR